MADNFWQNNDADNDGNNANNWSLGRVPTTGDQMYFEDSNTSDDCTFTASVSCSSLRFNSNYTGDVFWTNGSGLTTTGDWRMDGGSGRMDFGSGTHECGGDANFSTSTSFALNFESSTVILSGTSKAFRWANNDQINGSCTFRITGSYTGSASDAVVVAGTATLDIDTGATFNMGSSSNLTINDGATFICDGTWTGGSFADWSISGNLEFRGAATFGGAGDIRINATANWSVYTGTFTTVSSLDITCTSSDSPTLPTGTYAFPMNVTIKNTSGANGTFIFPNATITFEASCTFEEVYTFSNYDLVIDMATNNPTLKFEGNLVFDLNGGSGDDGEIVFQYGTNAIQFTGNTTISHSNVGSSNKWRVPGSGDYAQSQTPTLGDITVTGDLELSDDTYVDSIAFNSGTQTDGLDLAGNELISEGNITFNSGYDGGTFAGDGGRMYARGNLSLDGQTFTATALWEMAARGTLSFAGTGDIEYCRVPGVGGAAYAENWTDSGNNKNIAFAAQGDQYTQSVRYDA